MRLRYLQCIEHIINSHCSALRGGFSQLLGITHIALHPLIAPTWLLSALEMFSNFVTVFHTVNPIESHTLHRPQQSAVGSVPLSWNLQSDFQFCRKKNQKHNDCSRGMAQHRAGNKSHCRLSAHRPQHCVLSVDLWNDPGSIETTELGKHRSHLFSSDRTPMTGLWVSADKALHKQLLF